MNDWQAAKTDVFWDALGLGHPHSGVGRHAFGLQLAMESLGVRPKVLSSSVWLRRLKCVEPNLNGVRAGLTVSKRSIFHGLSNLNVPCTKPRNLGLVLTIHDLIPLIFPQHVSKYLHFQMKHYLPRILSLVDAVIVVSDWTKRSLIEFFPEVETKCVMIPNAYPKFSGNFKSVSEQIEVFSVGRNESYKRLNFLCEVLQHETKFRLSIVTDRGGVRSLKQKYLKQTESGQFNFFHSLSNELLTLKYKQCDIYVQPSLVEGFCLPAVEALAHAKPVVFVKGSGIDEVVDRFGIGLSPEDDGTSWLDAFMNAVQLGKEASFSVDLKKYFESSPDWHEIAKRTLDLYDKIL